MPSIQPVVDNTSTHATKRALVLGCGAVAGAAWMIPALAQVRHQLNWNPEDADVFIGTSVGAVLVSLMAGGISLDDLIASQEETPAENKYSKIWNHDKDSGPWYPPLPTFKFTAKNLFKKMRRGELSSLAGWVGLLPQGGFDMTPFVTLIDRVKSKDCKNKNWVNHNNCWLVAADNDTGERKVFGRDMTEARTLDISLAVCASYGVPGWCPPVIINNRTYIDGGIISPCSADLLVDTDVDEVIMLVPMACANPDKPFSWFKKIERSVRKGMTAIVDKEVALLEAAGKKVIRIEPTAADLNAFGYNMMDPRRRKLVYAASLKSSKENVRQAMTKALTSSVSITS
jgi:NTE family protein